ncbi:Hypothetical_protein [Hexamita inflata]|uniref:Hypothetical_protein n=1 Tax=Hexamita inflata TaxID=28002 RepID=A0ABP1KJ28_9EUKA
MIKLQTSPQAVSHTLEALSATLNIIRIQIAEVLVSNSSFSASSSNAGAFLGTFSEIYYGCIMKIVKSSINDVNVTAPQNFGLVIGYQYSSYSVSTSLSQGNNYINNIKQQNCVNFANTCNIFTNTRKLIHWITESQQLHKTTGNNRSKSIHLHQIM